MLTKHFWKTLVIFLIMIMIGLIGIFLAGSLDKSGAASSGDSQSSVDDGPGLSSLLRNIA